MECDLAVQVFLALCFLKIFVDARRDYPWLDDNSLLVIYTISEFPSRRIGSMAHDNSLLAQRFQGSIEVVVVIPAKNYGLVVTAPVQSGGQPGHLNRFLRCHRPVGISRKHECPLISPVR